MSASELDEYVAEWPVENWQGQDTFVDGLAQETCRDFGHTGWGLAAAVNVAETAWHQGVNLYGEPRERLVDGVYFHTRDELGATVRPGSATAARNAAWAPSPRWVGNPPYANTP